MKNIIKAGLLVFLIISNLSANLSANLSVEELSKEQLNKLNSAMIQKQGDNLVIEEYNFINFKDKVLFSGKYTNKIIIKTKSTMKKGIINNDMFLAFSSSIIDQSIYAIFSNPLYMNKIESTGLFIDKPSSFDLNIELVFNEKGFHILIDDGLQKRTDFMHYSQIFNNKIQ